MSGGPAGPLDLIIDASVGVKWFVPESYSVEASRLLAPDIRRHVPALFFTEVSQTIWKKIHVRHEILADDGREIIRGLLLLPIEAHPMAPLFEASFEIALQTGRSVYDSVYLALAEIKGWRLVTADERLRNALRGQAIESSLLWVADVPAHIPVAVSIEGEGAADPRPRPSE